METWGTDQITNTFPKGVIPFPELHAGITAVLEGIGFTGGAAASYNLAQGIKDCDAAWQELFGAFD